MSLTVAPWKSRISAAFRLIQITPCRRRTPACRCLQISGLRRFYQTNGIDDHRFIAALIAQDLQVNLNVIHVLGHCKRQRIFTGLGYRLLCLGIASIIVINAKLQLRPAFGNVHDQGVGFAPLQPYRLG